MTEKELLDYTQQSCPEFKASSLSEVEGGGSDRKYYRLVNSSAQKIILMHYSDARPDNAKFIYATEQLNKLGCPTPKIYANDSDRMLIWLEDLGASSLYSLATDQNSKQDNQTEAYQLALEAVLPLHQCSINELSEKEQAQLEPPFDQSLYRWEQGYFFQHFVTHYCSLSPMELKELQNLLTTIPAILAAEPRCLVHRDFQSQNIMLKKDNAILIDYQGLRAGLAEYDLASLLLDPYVDLDATQSELLRATHLAKLTGGANTDPLRRYHLCAAQRLMQALGAYGNLSRNQQKPHFAQYIPAALNRLLALSAAEVELQCLDILAEKLQS